MTTKAMSPLQQRMLEDMQLRGLSARTQEAYARAVWQLAQYYRRSPDQLSDAELRRYFLYLANEKKLARPTATIALCGIKFFYEQTLKQPWPTLRFVRPPREWKLPAGAKPRRGAPHAARGAHSCLSRLFDHHQCLRLALTGRHQITGTGCRQCPPAVTHSWQGQEGSLCAAAAVDPAIAARSLARASLTLWLFPAPTRHGLAHSLAHDGGPVTRSSLQSAFRSAVQRAGINKRAHVHTLRHSYATHMLEANFNLRVIHDHLGHRSPRSTAVYTHLTHAVRAAVTEPLNQLMTNL
jgi:integrase/recombinase XerD